MSEESNFSWPMRLLAPKRRRALGEVYRMCRVLDDIADGDAPAEERLAQLAAWEAAFRDASHRLPERLRRAMADYALPAEPFFAMIEALRLDVSGAMLRPTEAMLTQYCDGVATAAGRLALPLFGCSPKQNDAFAQALGQALQRINILRDIGEDAARGRIYLPREWLEAEGLAAVTPEAAAAQPCLLRPVCRRMCADAQARLTQARTAFSPPERFRLLPAFAMAEMYRALLSQMTRDGFGYRRAYRLGRPAKAAALLRSMGWVRLSI